VKNVVSKLLDNRLVYILVSLVAAFTLWLWVVNSVNPSQRTNLTFQVQYEGLAVLDQYSLRLAYDVPETVRMHVTASATDMMRLEQNLLLIVDVSQIREPGEHDVSFRMAAFPPGTMPANMSYSPLQGSNTSNTIVVRTNRVTARTFPVGTTGISFNVLETEDEAGYAYVGDETVSVEPETIDVDGPEEILAQIAAIEVETEFRTPLSETTTQTGTLRVYDHAGEIIPDTELTEVFFAWESIHDVRVNVTVPIRMLREVPLQPVFLYGAGANEDNLRYELSQETVFLIGEVDVLRGVDYLELGQIRMDRVGLRDSVRRDIPVPPLTEVVDGVTQVDVQLHIQDVEERTMTVSSNRVRFIGVPEGVDATAAFGSITLVIRGPEEIVEELDESSIAILINLTDYVGRTGHFNVETFTVLVEDWPPEVVGAVDPGRSIIVNIQRQG